LSTLSDYTGFSPIRNADTLIDHGQCRVREDALRIIAAGLRAADPGAGTRELVCRCGDVLHVGEHRVDLSAVDNVYVVGAGKGSLPIAAVLEDVLADRLTAGVLAVKDGEHRRLRTIDVREAGHPIPDARSVDATRAILALADRADNRDLVIAAVTGGASALMTLPIDGVSLTDLQRVTDLLLRAGAPIDEINAVRRHLCQVKGGRLLARIQPAEAVTLTLDTAQGRFPWPDVCLPDPTSFADAIGVLKQRSVWEKGPALIREYLQEGVDHPEWETLKTISGMRAHIISVADPGRACEAAALAAEALGYCGTVLSTIIDGEAREAAHVLAGITREIALNGRPFEPPCALISGGELTVNVGAASGRGGPNQEFALAISQPYRFGCEVACISVDTDGTDGPTDVAGGIVDAETASRAAAMGLDLGAYLRDHDSYAALQQLGDHIVTGHTGTNIMNLRAIVVR